MFRFNFWNRNHFESFWDSGQVATFHFCNQATIVYHRHCPSPQTPPVSQRKDLRGFDFDVCGVPYVGCPSFRVVISRNLGWVACLNPHVVLDFSRITTQGVLVVGWKMCASPGPYYPPPPPPMFLDQEEFLEIEEFNGKVLVSVGC